MMNQDKRSWVYTARAEIARVVTLPWPMFVLALVGVTALVPALLADLRISTGSPEAATQLPSSFGLSVCAILFGIFGCIVSGADLRSGELNLQFLAVPRRFQLAIAKLSAVLILTATASALTFALDRGVRSIVSNGARSATLTIPQAGIGYVGSCLMFATLGMMLTVLLRSTMLAVASFTLAPILLLPLLQRVAPLIDAALPFSASGLAVSGSSELSLSWNAGLGIVFGWLLASVAIFTLMIHRRDT